MIEMYLYSDWHFNHINQIYTDKIKEKIITFVHILMPPPFSFDTVLPTSNLAEIFQASHFFLMRGNDRHRYVNFRNTQV